MASMAVATPFSYRGVEVAAYDYEGRATYRSDLLTNQFRSINELLVGRSLAESLREILHRQLAHCSADAKGFHSIGPEELITKERLDDRGDSSWMDDEPHSVVDHYMRCTHPSSLHLLSPHLHGGKQRQSA